MKVPFKKQNLKKQNVVKQQGWFKKNKRNLIGVSSVVLVLITLAIVVATVALKNRMIKIAFSTITPELARAMEYDVLEDEEQEVEGTEGNVEFGAFFLRDITGDGYAERLKGTCKEIGETDTLYMEINVKTGGKLTKGKIEIKGTNFTLQTALPEDGQLKTSYMGNDIKVIEFKELLNGTQKMLDGVIKSSIGSYTTKDYSRDDNKIVFTGTYVDEAEQEHEITKEIPLTIDWYGTTSASIYSTNQTNRDLPDRIDEENGTLKLSFSIDARETKAQLNLSKNHVEGTIPKLQDYLPKAVRLTSSQTNTVFDYNEDTGEFTIDRTAVVTEDGNITSSLSRSNTYTLEVTYPIDAYHEIGEDTVTISIPVKTQYEGFNNQNGQFTNPHKSNVSSTTIVANFSNPPETKPSVPSEQPEYIMITSINVTIGKYMYGPKSGYVVSKQKPLRIYNELSSEEKDDTYIVRWEATAGTKIEEGKGFILKETENEKEQKVDQFIKTDSNRESMEDVTTNVGIYFSGASNLLGEDGWIRVYDEETGNLVGEFSKDNWSKYTESNPYKYEIPVKHIRVETSEVIKERSFYVYNIKELNDEVITTKYDREAFDNLQYIESTLTGYLGNSYTATKVNQANYEAPYSVATISISKNTFSTQVTEEDVKITINADYSVSSNQVGWVDGSFLVKLPTEISKIEINSVEIDNSQVSIVNHELIENDEGKFIKINTKNKIENQQIYDITINANITPDPRIVTMTKQIELYASNKESCDYYYKDTDKYDVNDNLNKDEKVNKRSININLVSPNSLLANQTISEFDNKKTEIVSPQIAEIKPIYATLGSERQTVKIGVQIRNNYSSAIGEIKLLGRIPFEGNTYAISKREMNSNFSTTMTEAGIELPTELEGKVKVYYSDNPTADNDLEKDENNWQEATNVKKWEDIKSFLIDFEDEKLAEKKEYVFYYTVNMPEKKELNKVSYSHFGVYFTLETEQGKYKTKTEPNKIGIRIADKYDLELKKYQKGRENLVKGATYVLREILEDNQVGTTKTATTNDDGILEIKDLYADKTYEIQEIKTPDDYEINEDVIRFIGHVDKQTGQLTVEKEQGNTRNNKNIEITQNDDKYKISIEVEDEVKAKLKIVKQEKDQTTKVKNVIFKITGQGLPKEGKVVKTNREGEIEVTGLKVEEEYTLEEIQAKGYYLLNPIKFKITNNSGNYTFEKIEEEGNGEVKEYKIEENGVIPTLILTLEDEKIPRYNLEIIKIKRITETTLSTDELIAKAYANLAGDEVETLQGARFKLYKGMEDIGTYETGADGKVTIDDLYLYVDGKDEEATYTLKEIFLPAGYAKVKDITFKAEIVEGKLKLINVDGTEEDYTSEGNNKIKLLIQDSPSFKLIKKDAEEQTPLANIKFTIYNVEDGEEPARNSKGEIIGNKEIINGREYYTLTTNDAGEITEDLPEGLYKAVELDAPDQYDISNATYYFGIGASREGIKVPEAEWGKAIGGTGNDYINSVAETEDGGYIVGGYFAGTIDLGGTAGTITSNGTSYVDGIIIKYGRDGEAEWGKAIGGTHVDQINIVAETRDGGYIIGGEFKSKRIDLGGTAGTIIGNNTDNYAPDGMIIKLDSKGEAKWGKAIGGTNSEEIKSIATTADGGNIVVGVFNSTSIDLGGTAGTIRNNSEINYGDTSYSDGMIIKYDENGEAEWGKAIGGTSSDEITSVAETRDGGYIVGGDFESESIDLGETAGTITGNDTKLLNPDGMIIKLDSKGNAEWGKAIGGTGSDYINSVAETRDGDYIVGGYFNSTSIDLGKIAGTIISNGIIDGMIIKLDSKGEDEWGKAIGGTGSDYINSVAETSDGNYIVGGYFNSEEIDLETAGKIKNNGSSDGMIIKYDKEGKIEWGKAIGGTGNDYINSVAETEDGGFIVGGTIFSGSIDLGGTVGTITNNGRYDGIIIKYDKIKDIPKMFIKNGKSIGGENSVYINSVTETKDGSYIVGGYFSGRIELEGTAGAITSLGSSYVDGMIIKYDNDGNTEWGKAIGGISADCITSVVATSDGGYIVGGYFKSSRIDLGEAGTITSSGGQDGMIIKYDVNGNAEWSKAIGGTSGDYINSVAATSDGGYIVGGYFASESIELGGTAGTITNNGTSYSDGMIIKLDSEGNIKWGKAIGGTDRDEITSVAETSDGGYIVGGYFDSESIELGGTTGTLKNNSVKNNSDGMLIKYGSKGNVEWGKALGGTAAEQIKSVAATADGGFIVGGYFTSKTIDLGGIAGTITNNSNDKYGIYYADGIIVKYNSNGTADWGKAIGGTIGDEITSVVATSDGGCIVGGYFESSSIILGGTAGTITNNNSGYSDGMIIKYDENGEAEWGETIGGEKSDYINSIVETTEGYLVGGYFLSKSIDLGKIAGTITNNHTLATNKYYDGMIIKVAEEMGVPEVQELTVENKIKEFKITTEVKPVNEVKGGIISGEGNIYETVKYGNNNTLNIEMRPEPGYEISLITINGVEQKFTPKADNSYVLEAPFFTDMKEDKHIVVSFVEKDKKAVVIKEDSKTHERLPGATFKLDQIEERTIGEEVVGSFVDNGKVYYEPDLKNEIPNAKETLTKNSEEYWFEEKDGKIIPTNSKTYTGNSGIGNSTAQSYIPINLEGKAGEQFLVVVNAYVSSQSSYDYGYAHITEDTNAPSRTNATGRLIYLSGTSSSSITPKDYVSELLDGGQTYYLHLGYYKDSSQDTGEDQIVINSIKVYKAKEVSYNFIENEEKYESTNVGKDNTVANSYIELNLERYEGKYDVIVNANISSEKYDYGYAHITKDKVAPSYSTYTDRFIYISGTSTDVTEPKDYVKTIEGGQKYYLHFGYYKNASTSDGDDKFTINSIKIVPNEDYLYHTEVTTDINGKGIILDLPYGKYKITETKAPEGYVINDSIPIADFSEVQERTFTITDERKGKVTVKHLFKDNNQPVAEEDHLEGKVGDPYSTKPHLDLKEYEIEKEEDGSIKLPNGATGQYEEGEKVVTYYYVKKEIPLIVHHYVDGTFDPVELDDGSKAPDVTDSGKEGEPYTTKALENLADEYKLSSTPSNAQGTYEYEKVEVTYYYDVKQFNVTTKVRTHTEENLMGEEEQVRGGDILGEKESPYETVLYGESNTREITATPEEGYQVKSIEINKRVLEPDEYTVLEGGKIRLNTIENITEDKEVVVEFEPIPAKVIVHHYIYDKVTKEHTENKVPLADGTEAPDEEKIGKVGDIFVSKAKEGIHEAYELYEEPEETGGEMTKETKELKYYYIQKDANIVTNEITKDGTSKITSKGEEVHYKITYTAEIDNYIGDATVTITDTLPYEIDTGKSTLGENARYDRASKTITWEETISNINTANQNQITIEKDITVVFSNLNTDDESFINKVEGEIHLNSTNQTEKTEPAEKETIVEIPAEVLVHHYIYDEKTHENTTTQIADDVTMKGFVGRSYTTHVAEVPANYECIDNTPDKYQGKYAEEKTVVIYYYKVKDPTLENTIEKGATANKTDGEGNPVLTQEDGIVTYNIRYETNVSNYIGKATIEIVDTLPAKIDTGAEGTDLQSGEYSEANNTITWKQDITGIDTFAEGHSKNIVIEKTIKVVYKEQNVNSDLTNTVKGTTKLYYPDDSNKPGEELKTKEVTDEETVKQEYKKEVTVEKIWDHGENEYGYPEDVEIKLMKNGTQEVGRYTVNEGNGWKHTFTDLPKYDEEGNEIEYTAEETDNENLKYYRKTIEGTKVKNTYIGPVISQTKDIETEYNNTYVIQGERITYKVIVTNKGEIGKDVLIKDSIPNGTTFEEGSIRVNDQEEYEGTNYSTKTRDDLTSTGIEVNVPGAKDGQDGTVTLSFDVTVDRDATGNVSNIATVDGKETNKVEKPIVEFEKLATVERTNPESGLEGNQVTVKDIINYTIRVRNTGTIDTGEITVKDNVPEGTQAKEIKGEGSLKGNEITWTIDNVGAEQVKEVGFKAEVEYIREDGVIIENVATVNGETTNKTENPYVKPEPTIETTLQKNGTGKITSKAEKVSYEIEYRATIRDFNGKAKITIVDHLPYPIDKNNSNLAEGKYNPDNQTITWEEEIEGIDTFTTGEAKEIIRRKTIELKFEYGNLNGTSGTMTNVVNTKIELQEPTKENPEQYETVKDKEDEAEKETLIEIPAEVLVHHYIYDEERDERTTVKIADDVLMRGLVGKDYQTEVAQVPANYECINTKPDRNKGKYEENQIVVTYYYKLIKPELDNNMEKTATANKANDEGVQVLTKENGVVTYNIRYTVNVNKYIGKATIEIEDTLPAKLDTGAEGIDLQKGKYNEENNTITWTEEIENIDTFAEGQARNIVIEKTIKVVYKEQDVNSDLTNTVKGTTKLYYPEDKSNRPGEELETVEGTDEETVKQEYLTKLIVEKEWDDSNDRKGRRPESILVDIKEMPKDEITTVELNEGNGWRNEQDGLRKYNEAGEKITYEVTEKEKKEKDLEFYEEPQYKNVESQDDNLTTYVYTITNEYKLKETDLNTTLTKTGTEEIITSKDIVEYTITFTADIAEYLGEGKIRIVDYLPYKIELENSDIANGTYDDDAQTITWEEPVEHINTDLDGSKHIEITKTIRVLYKDVDLTQEKMTNNVTGKIELFENDTKDEKETTYDTDINVNGKVIVRFVDKETGEDIVNKVVTEEGERLEERYNYEIEGKVGDEYTANEKEIQNYDYVETQGEKTGKVKEEDTEIIHYYVRSKAKVIVKYVERTTEIDEDGNEQEVLKELLPDEIINGQVFDKYTTEEKRIENYKFIFSTDNTEGEMTKEDITVIYYYEKIPSKVTVKYVERTTETDEDGNEHEVLKELLPEDVIDGYAGDEYETERKEVKNYRPAEPEPENAKGKMAEEPTEVVYYYEKIPSGILSVKYVDIDTGKTIIKIDDKRKLTPEEREKLEELLEHEDTELEDDQDTDEDTNEENNEDITSEKINPVETYNYEITGYVGDEYETEQKEIPYYIYVKSTDNTKGELTEEGDTVIYYYRKQEFNISVNKYLDSVIVNGEHIGYNNNKFMKQEVVGTMINSTNVQVTYGIEVRNTGAIDGTAKIKDTIPEGFTIEWLEEGLTAIDERNIEAEVNLKAGESKVLKLTLNWIRNKDNFGDKTNTVSIVETSNIPGFEDSNSEDNTSEATTLLAIKTGISDRSKIALSIFIVLSILTETIYLTKTRKIRMAEVQKEIVRLMSK